MKTILVVENDTLINTLFKRILIDYGYKVINAIDGESALELYDTMTEKPEIVIVDYRLPQLNGLDLSKELIKRNPELKILMISGDPQVNQTKAQEMGIKFRKKPISKKELISEVQLFLQDSFLSTSEEQNSIQNEESIEKPKDVLEKHFPN